MKKLTLTSILAISIALPSYADIASNANSATCNNDTLETTSGSSTLEATWTANTISLKWYNGDTEVTPSNSTASTCTYDSGITLPSNEPTKTGYIFAGWKVKPSAFDLSTLNLSMFNSANYYNADIEAGAEWTFSLKNGSVGVIKGKALCSAKSGDYHNYAWGGNSSDWTATETELTSASGEAQYCWCAVTGHAEMNDSTFMDVTPSRWVYMGDYGDSSGCSYCDNACPESFLEYPAVIEFLLGMDITH